MRGLRLPGWLVYPWLVLMLLFIALGRREHADAPPPPPPLSAGEGVALAQTSPIDPAVLVRVRSKGGADLGAAFSVGDAGVWLTARSVVAGCAHPAVMVSDTDGVAATVSPGRGEAAVLVTAKGAPALPIAAEPPKPGELAFAPGFPHGRPGEVALRLLGAERLHVRDRVQRELPVLAWAELGRTENLKGALAGLFGAPALDGEARVVGVTLAEAPRRGRIYTTTPGELATPLAAAKIAHGPQASGAVITPENYGLAADDLRRALRIAPVACLRR